MMTPRFFKEAKLQHEKECVSYQRALIEIRKRNERIQALEAAQQDDLTREQRLELQRNELVRRVKQLEARVAELQEQLQYALQCEVEF